MAARYWWVAVLIQEKRDATGNLVEAAKSLVDPKCIIATNDQQARLLVSAEIPDNVRNDPNLFDRVEVAVTPF